jgi:hypothetical protein
MKHVLRVGDKFVVETPDGFVDVILTSLTSSVVEEQIEYKTTSNEPQFAPGLKYLDVRIEVQSVGAPY